MNKFQFWAVGALAVLGVLSAGQAKASLTSDPFNVLVFGNYQATSGDVEGSLGVGGSATMSSYSVGTKLPESHGTSNSLVVGGDLNAIYHWQVFNGNAAYGGTLTSSPSFASGSGNHAVDDPTAFDFASAQSYFTSLSSHLASLTQNGTVQDQHGTYILTGTDNTLNVFNVDAASWNNAYNREINAPVGSTVIINVPGTASTFGGGFVVNNTDASHVLVNFVDATSLTLNGIAMEGSLLAPKAEFLNGSGQVNGQGVFASFNSGIEFHDVPFSGGVPEPSTGAMAGVALLGLLFGFSSRRSRSRLAV